MQLETTIPISLSVHPADIQVIAEYLNSRNLGECTSAQHEAITYQLLNRVVAQAAIKSNLQTPAISHVIERDYAAFGRSQRRPKLPRAKRTVI
jgi:hypothetical protein